MRERSIILDSSLGGRARSAGAGKGGEGKPYRAIRAPPPKASRIRGSRRWPPGAAQRGRGPGKGASTEEAGFAARDSRLESPRVFDSRQEPALGSEDRARTGNRDGGAFGASSARKERRGRVSARGSRRGSRRIGRESARRSPEGWTDGVAWTAGVRADSSGRMRRPGSAPLE
ncbi:hypothetical protein KM043_001546 [Ampulex compressa]|nr:hypothetical protein KM043_001546 [Ampulex compressa]